MMLLGTYGKGTVATLAVAGFAHGLIVAVVVALLLAVLIGGVLWMLPPTRPYAGIVAVVVFVILLLLALV